MPELAEVARAVHHLRANLRNQVISKVSFPQEDPIIFQTPKTGLTIKSFAERLQGNKIIDAQQQGKYFWLVMDKPPHPLMHFGMTGWVKFKGKVGAGVDYRRMQDDGERKKLQDGEPEVEMAEEEWPPRFWKFDLETTSGINMSFIDGRRLGRVRLLDCQGDEIRTVTPLKENGPDPVVDSDKLTVDFLTELTGRRKVPIKALLLDQAALSGIGNWMADEILYQASIHPAIYANQLSQGQVESLHKQIENVCKTAVSVLADSTKFPAEWIMKYRWDKGKKDANRLPNGEKIVHIEVGGRTSAIVPSRQKKSGLSSDVAEGGQDEDADGDEQPKLKTKAAAGSKRGRKIKEEEATNPADEKPAPTKKGRKASQAPAKPPAAITNKKAKAEPSKVGTRRSSRRTSGA